MAIDWTKPIQTTDGKPARVLCTDLKHDHPYVVAAEHHGKEILWTVTDTGRVRGSTPGDGKSGIINVPEKRTVYINFYEDGVWAIWNTREGADKEAASYTTLKRHSRVKVEYTVGQFDI